MTEEEDVTEKLQRSRLELHSFPFTAKEEKQLDTKKTEGEAITLLLRLINNKLMLDCAKKREEAVWHHFQACRTSKLSNKGTRWFANIVLSRCITLVCVCSRHVGLFLSLRRPYCRCQVGKVF